MRNLLTYEELAAGKAKRTGHTWFYFRDWDISIVASPKCGSSAIKQFIWINELEDKVSHINRDEARGEIVAVVRNPFARFESLWKSKCRDKMPIRDKDVHGLSPRALMAHISSGKKDIHWTPQATLIGDTENITLVPLENLNDWWKMRGYGDLPVVNETSGKMQTNETIHAWICNYYAEDFILYAKACGFS